MTAATTATPGPPETAATAATGAPAPATTVGKASAPATRATPAPAATPADRSRTVDLVLCAVLAALSGALYRAFFAGPGFLLPVAGAAVAPVALVGLGARWRLRGGRAAALWLAPLPLYAAWALFTDRLTGGLPGPDAFAGLRDGLTDGWSRMLDVGLPAEAGGELLVVPVVLTWLVAGGAGALAVRRQAAAVPLVPPLVAFVAALVLVAARGEAQPLVAALFALAGLALVLVRADRTAADGLERLAADVRAAPPGLPGAGGEGDRGTGRGTGARRGRRRPPGLGAAARGLPFVAGAVGVAALVATAVPTGDRFDPRTLREERVEIDDTLSPLVALKAQLKDDDPAELFTVRLDGAPDGLDRIRVAALDTYDGALWTSSGDYRLVGGEVETDPTLAGPPERALVRQQVAVDGLEGPFLPALGRPTEVAGPDDVAADAASGVLVSPRASLGGLTYDLVSEVTLASDDQVAAAGPNRAPELAPLGTPPADLPPPLRTLAQAWAAESETYGGELLRIRDHLLEIPYDDSERAEPGHSYGALLRLVGDDPAERRGYAEQFATAFVLMARERQVPARLAVGYLLPEPGDDGTYAVTEAQAHAWPEVNLAGLGWVPIEPTDVTKIAAPNDDAEEKPPPGPGETPAEKATPGPADTGATAGAGATGGGRSGVARAVAAGSVLLVALLALGLLVPPVAKAWRRARRRRRRGTAAQVAGAWDETLDRLHEHGLPPGPARTPGEVAALTAERMPEPVAAGVGGLVPLVGVAVYAAEPPGPEDAARAWELERVTRRAVRRQAGMRRRVVAHVDPRPLLPRRARPVRLPQ